MQALEIIIPYRQADRKYRIYDLGDEHMGIVHCAEDEIVKLVKTIKADRYSKWVGMGDKGELITPSDPRWDSGIVAPWVHDDNIATDQTNRYCELYSPISSQCVGLIDGNHEYAIKKYSHTNVQKNICEKLGVNDLGYSAFVRFSFRRQNSAESHSVVGFYTHGSGWAVTKGAKLNKLQRLMDAFEADMYATGHMHDLITDTKPYLTLDSKGRIKEKTKVGAVTGCFFKTYMQGANASYGERRNYPPTTIGCAIFEIDLVTGDIDVSRSA